MASKDFQPHQVDLMYFQGVAIHLWSFMQDPFLLDFMFFFFLHTHSHAPPRACMDLVHFLRISYAFSFPKIKPRSVDCAETYLSSLLYVHLIAVSCCCSHFPSTDLLPLPTSHAAVRVPAQVLSGIFMRFFSGMITPQWDFWVRRRARC